MPGNRTTSQAQQKSLKINDWTLGIVNQDESGYSSTGSAGQPLNVVPNNQQKVSSSAYTYGCFGLPGGGLLLGPTVFSVTDISCTLPSGSSTPVLTGIVNNIAAGSEGDLGTYLIINTNVGGDLTTTAYYYANGGATSTSAALYSVGSLNISYLNCHTFPFLTAINPNSSGTIYIALLWTADVDTIFYSPSYTNGTVTNPTPGTWTIPQNGQIWGLGQAASTNQIENVTLPAVYFMSPVNYVTTNSLAWIDTGTPTIADFDNPTYALSYATITNGEVLLIKGSEGANLITGSIESPTITKLPSVRGTNGLVGQAEITPLGAVYRSHNNGVWAWNGGSSSTKISAQISDSVWYDSQPATYVQQPSGAILTNPFPAPTAFHSFTATYCNNNIFFDTGYFYNIDTNSWWRLPIYGDGTNSWTYQTAFSPYFYKINSNISNQAGYFPCPISAIGYDCFGGGQLQSVDYSFNIGSGNFQFTPPFGCYSSYWESNPIQLPSEGYVEVQEISVVMQGYGHLTLAIDTPGSPPGAVQHPFVTEAVNNYPFSRVRFIISAETDVITVKLAWVNITGDCPTPIIESIQIDYIDRYPVPVG